jgi:hypothetical protein
MCISLNSIEYVCKSEISSEVQLDKCSNQILYKYVSKAFDKEENLTSAQFACSTIKKCVLDELMVVIDQNNVVTIINFIQKTKGLKGVKYTVPLPEETKPLNVVILNKMIIGVVTTNYELRLYDIIGTPIHILNDKAIYSYISLDITDKGNIYRNFSAKIKEKIYNKIESYFHSIVVSSSSTNMPITGIGIGSTLFVWSNHKNNTYYSKKTIIDDFDIVKNYIWNRQLEKSFTYCTHIRNPEQWLSSFTSIINYLMQSNDECSNPVLLKYMINLYKAVSINAQFDYIRHTIKFNFLKIGLKAISNKSFHIAYVIAMLIKSGYLFKCISIIARSNKEEGIAECARVHSGLCEGEMLIEDQINKISDYANKHFQQMDLHNLINDIDTILNIDNLHELDLEEFNSWDINIGEYQTAIDMELNNQYDKAKALYLKNGLNSDAKRIDGLKHSIIPIIDAEEYVNPSP